MISQNFNILLADDDMDDCFFFKNALEELAVGASLKTVHDGEQLMQHLQTASENLPNALFLDLNMPRKSGFECVAEIENHSRLKNIPVIIMSTSYNEEKATQLYQSGARYYITKPSNFKELKIVIEQALTLLAKNNLPTSGDDFVINKPKNSSG